MYPPNRSFQPAKQVPVSVPVPRPVKPQIRKNQMTLASSLPMGVPQFRPIPKIVTPAPEFAEIQPNPVYNQVLEPSGFKPLSIDRSGIEAIVSSIKVIFLLNLTLNL